MNYRFFITFLLSLCVTGLSGQNLSVCWDELTSPEFVTAVEKADGVCIIPIGVIEKHGAHLPLGTDVFTAREMSIRAALNEYCLVFPYYYVGQIFEAKQQPGTIAYSHDLLFKMLDETCREISRNGIKKIIIVNGHGGNNYFLKYFCQIQLAEPRDYAVYLFQDETLPETLEKLNVLRSSTTGGHADEVETSSMMVVRPDLVKVERAGNESGVDMSRLNIPNSYTGIWWYARYPNHYAGDARGAKPEIGEISFGESIYLLTNLIKAVKEDTATHKLQNEFFEESLKPLETKVKL